MQTSDLNVNNTESDHANAIFRQFQDAIFSREHTYVKTLTKIIFDLLQWQEIAKLSMPKKAAIASFIWTTFRAHFGLLANDITRYRSHVIFQSMRRHFSPVKSLAASGHFIVHRLKMFVKMKVLSPIECFHSRGQHLYKFIGTKESVCIRKEFNSQRIIQSLIFPVIQNGICVFRYGFLFVEKSKKNIVRKHRVSFS